MLDPYAEAKMLTLDLNLPISAPDVARATGGSPFTLKNYIKRGLMLFPGVEGRPGHARPMTAWGAYEFAFLVDAQRAGLSLDAARAVWRKIVTDQLLNEGKADKRDVAFIPNDDAEPVPLQPQTVYLQYGKNNQAPQTAPDFMNGDLLSKIFVAVSVSHDPYTDTFTAAVAPFKAGEPLDVSEGFASFFTTKVQGGRKITCDPARAVHLFDLNSMIYGLNLRLLAEDGDDE
jgi:hypothetical protein